MKELTIYGDIYKYDSSSMFSVLSLYVLHWILNQVCVAYTQRYKTIKSVLSFIFLSLGKGTNLSPTVDTVCNPQVDLRRYCARIFRICPFPFPSCLLPCLPSFDLLHFKSHIAFHIHITMCKFEIAALS